jgi:hypothetical protein
VIEHARRSPGKAHWGAANPASLERIALERIARKMNVKVPVVPHEGGGDLMINVLNGTLDIGVGEVEELKGQLQAGKVRILAVLSDKRMAQLPQVPTAREQGVDVVVRKFRGLAAPRGVAPEAVKALETGLRKVLAAPAYRKSYTDSNLVPVMLGHDEAVRFTNEVATDIAQTFRELGITPEMRVRRGDLRAGPGRDRAGRAYLRLAAASRKACCPIRVGAAGLPRAVGWALGCVGVLLCVRSLLHAAARQASRRRAGGPTCARWACSRSCSATCCSRPGSGTALATGLLLAAARPTPARGGRASWC